jgi:2-(1,2-epoxy-1,2-dihydrophenyl)acetyl-CoA isomerase
MSSIETGEAAVLVERRSDGVATVLLNRPKRANAFDDETMFVRLPQIVAELGADPDVRAVVISGTGSYFSAGIDLTSKALEQPDEASLSAMVRGAQEAIITLRTMPKPSIAAVNGPAIGAAFGLALGCDLRVISPAATFSAPFVRMGMVPDNGVSYTLPRIVGASRALEIVLTGRTVDSDEALRIGLANRVADDALEAAIELGAEIAKGGPRAIADTRRNVYAELEATIETSLRELEPASVAANIQGPEFAEYFPRYLEELRQRRSGGS